MNRRTLLGAAAAGALSAAINPPFPVLGSPTPAPTRTTASSTTTGAQKVLWVWAHPDDETLAGGLSLRQHLEGGKDCHILTCTRGEASGLLEELNGTGVVSDWGLLHDPAAEGYNTLSAADFGAARIREEGNALGCLLAGTTGSITLHEAGLSDGAVTQTDAYAAILAVVAQIGAPGEVIWLKGHSDLVTAEHPDHLAVGKALRQAAHNFPTTLGVNPRFYIDPLFWTWTSAALPLAARGNIVPAAGTNEAASTLNAYRAFNAWSPPETYAIGHQSVPGEWITPPKNVYHV